MKISYQRCASTVLMLISSALLVMCGKGAGTQPTGGTGATSGAGSGGGGPSSESTSGASASSASASGASASSGAGTTSSSSGGSGGAGVAFTVVTNRYDNSRSGVDLAETTLTTANVNKDHFGLLFSRVLDGEIYAQPLYLSGVHIAGGTHNVVYAATAHNTVYAYDADDAATSAPLWSKSMGPSAAIVPGTTVSCQDMQPEVGVTSTPVIDPSTGTMYVEAKGLENGQYVQRLHALDVTTGDERPGSPVVIAASVPGTGDGNVDGVVSFSAQRQLNRPGLLLYNGNVFLAFASHCDNSPYHGWVLGYDAKTLHQTSVHVNTAPGSEGGIWQAGIGLSADDTGIYAVSGNGSTNPTLNPPLIGIGVTRLDPTGVNVADWWVPTNFSNMNAADNDLASGAVLLPGSNLLLTGGKDGNMYVLDRTNLGKYNPGSDQILQTVQMGGHVHNGLNYWAGPTKGPWVYLWAENGLLTAYQVGTKGIVTKSASQITLNVHPGHPGGILTVSANGTTPGTGIVWASVPTMGDAWHSVAVGTLFAFDANDLTHELWDSNQDPTRDTLGNFAKFTPPVVANGRVYMGTFSNALRVYGLLP